MRLAGKAKAGFYPTPERVVEGILGYLSPTPGCQILDPCAGEGVALRRIADHLQGAAQAIELSRERAGKCRKLGLKTYCGDALGYRGRGFGLLYLNPPYDDGVGERLERTFLKHWSEALAPGGVLVYLIPERVLGAVEDYLTGWYDALLALRFPEPEYQAFHQVVVFGVRRTEPRSPGRLEVRTTATPRRRSCCGWCGRSGPSGGGCWSTCRTPGPLTRSPGFRGFCGRRGCGRWGCTATR